MSPCLDDIDPSILPRFRLIPHHTLFIPPQNHHHCIHQIEIQLCYALTFLDLSLLLRLLGFALAYCLSVQVFVPFPAVCHRENKLHLLTYVLKKLSCWCFIFPYSLRERVINFTLFHCDSQSLLESLSSVINSFNVRFAFVYLFISPSLNLRLSSVN